MQISKTRHKNPPKLPKSIQGTKKGKTRKKIEREKKDRA